MATYGNGSSGRFTGRAADYARWRPSYPAAVFDELLGGLDADRSIAVDVGAGTGISARLLADRGLRVVAVEPNHEMARGAAHHPRVQRVAAIAERLPLAGGSAALVLAAQSFHWFEAGAALAEFRRVLRPGGRLALLWNEKERADPATAAYSAAVIAAAEGDPVAQKDVTPRALLASPLFRDVRLVEFAHEQHLDEAGLVGRAASSSYVPAAGPARAALETRLRELVAAHGRAGKVALRYRVLLYVATRSPA